jgi:hypothetical protein
VAGSVRVWCGREVEDGGSAGRRAAIWLVRHDGVVVDVLHVFAIVQHVDELFEHGQIIRADFRGRLREEGDFLDF